MSLFLDQKYLSLISNRLPFFKRKADFLYNCRCVLCGDSLKKKSKARGYFFNYKSQLNYKCHNCGASSTFGSFLKNFDIGLYQEYNLEKFKEGRLNTSNSISKMVFEEPKFKTSEEKLIDKILDRLDQLPEDNEAVQFCNKRQIPKERFKDLYFIENIKDIVQLNDKYKASISTSEPRLVIPFYDTNGQLSGVTCRALRGEALRYITIKVKESAPLIFGLDSVNKNNMVYVVEGPIDSLFVDNCIAVNGTAFGKVNELSLDKFTVIFDNQPRNKEVCKLIEKNINLGYNVVIFPQTVVEKDINDMVMAGLNVSKIIKENTYSGLSAKAKFISWKRC